MYSEYRLGVESENCFIAFSAKYNFFNFSCTNLVLLFLLKFKTNMCYTLYHPA